MKTHVIKNNQGGIVETWNYPDDKLSPEDWIKLPENATILKLAGDNYAALLLEYPDLKTMSNPPPATDAAISVFSAWIAYATAEKVL